MTLLDTYSYGIQSLARDAGAERQALKRAIAAALLLTAASLAEPQLAQAQTAQSVEAPKREEITVTGTRIARGDGYEAPTPVTLVGVEDMQSMATPNVADYINTPPVFSGSVSPGSTSVTASTGGSNINALNLRSLGANRTLVLLDGQRVAGITVSPNK